MPSLMSMRRVFPSLSRTAPHAQRSSPTADSGAPPREPGGGTTVTTSASRPAVGNPLGTRTSTIPSDRATKFRLASRAQRDEIKKHRERLSRRLGRAVTLDEAARDWILSYAAEWRAKFEAAWREPAEV
jgi:hypothetical protein